MSVFHNNALIGSGAAAAAGAAEDNRSLRFNSGDSAFLNRTPSSAGNRKKFTYSLWVKRCVTGSRHNLFSTVNAATQERIQFGSNDKLDFIYSQGTANVSTEGLFRDLSAWYHIVFAVDTDQSTAADRVKLYVNGAQQTLSGTFPSSGTSFDYNNTKQHRIGSFDPGTGGTHFADCYFADIFLVDGSQLEPTSFGAYDSSGVWQAAAYSGTYGTNGFHLKFDDVSSVAALGTDSSGNGNTFTVNNITLNKASVSTSTITNVAAGNAWNQSKTWSNLVSGPSQGYASGNPITNGFDGSNSTLANASSAGGTMTFSAALGTGTFNVEMRFGNDQLYNGTTIDGVAPTSTSVANTIGHWTGITSFNVMTMNSTGLANNARCCWNWIKVNGKFLVDSGNSGDPGGGPPDLTIANTTNFDQLAVHDLVQTNVSITAIDSSTSKISVSGGTWEGSNGSGTSGGDTTVSTVAITTGDSFFDVPTNGTQSDTGAGGEVSGNYCTLNPLDNGGQTLSNGNLDIEGASGAWKTTRATVGLSSGKWYWEFLHDFSRATSTRECMVGIATGNATLTNYTGSDANGWGYYDIAGNIYNNGSGGVTSVSYDNGDLIGIAFDADNGKLYFSKNGTFINSGDPAAGTGAVATGLTSGPYFPAFAFFGTGTNSPVNFGARSFAYSAPSGFSPICTTLLPTPTIADGSDYFDAKLHTGNGSTQTISNFEFSPSFVWVKQRNTSRDHRLANIISGTGKDLRANANNAEITDANGITAFNSDGFSVGSSTGWNQSSGTYVSWCWDAGTSTVSNTDGSITSSVRANPTAGFSIVSWTSSSSVSTVGHGLNAAPYFIITKNRSVSNAWWSYHFGIGNTKAVRLDSSDAPSTMSSTWNNTSPTSSVFTVGGEFGNGNSMIAYCFAPVAGYSAVGSYTGTGSINSTPNFIYTGFRPRFWMHRRTDSAGSWMMLDAARDPDNVVGNQVYANLGNAEGSGTELDFLSNGVRMRASGSDINGSGVPYIYMCFAENPFQANGGLAR